MKKKDKKSEVSELIVSVRKGQRYDDGNHQIYVPQKIVPEHWTHATATKYGKKVIVIGDSDLWRINRKLFNKSLPNCRGSLKYFSGAKTSDLEHYMKPIISQMLLQYT